MKKQNILTILLSVLLMLVFAGGFLLQASSVIQERMMAWSGYGGDRESAAGAVADQAAREHDAAQGEEQTFGEAGTGSLEGDGQVLERSGAESPPESVQETEDIGPGYIPSSEDPVYERLADDPAENIPYQILWWDYGYTDRKNGISLCAYYPEIRGENIPNLSALNEMIRNAAVDMMSKYMGVYQELAGDIPHYDAKINGFVTYKSEKLVSIVFWESIEVGSTYCQDLYCLNLDLLNGRPLYSDELLNFDTELAKAFRRQEKSQKPGEYSPTATLSDGILLSRLAAPGSGIVFFTPVGLEIGYNYALEDGTFHYTTVTLKRFGTYTKQL